MIIKKLTYIVAIISLGFAIERNVATSPSTGYEEIDEELNFAAEIGYATTNKRGVFGQDEQGQFFSLYEKNPNHPEITLVKYVRAKKDRHNKGLFEYFEFDSKSSPEDSQDKGLFHLSSAEIKKRLVQNGPTY